MECGVKPETELDITDSIIEENAGVNTNGNIHNGVAIECYKIKIENSTIFGKVKVVLVDIVSNTIFTDFIRAANVSSRVVLDSPMFHWDQKCQDIIVASQRMLLICMKDTICAQRKYF